MKQRIFAIATRGKEEFRKLWFPCLSKDDMNHLFGANE